jgi:hypothetical protein
LYALQFSPRRPQGAVRFHGGDIVEEVVEPTDEVCANWQEMLDLWPLPDYALAQLVGKLGVPRSSILALRVGYDPEEACWVFPERDDRDRIVGLLRRFDHNKMSCERSHRGLTLPCYAGGLPPGPVYLAEGASDTAALHSVGRLAVGRSGLDISAAERLWIVRLLQRMSSRNVIVVGDRDPDGYEGKGPGTLAKRLQTALGRPIRWALPAPPYKDVRDQIKDGAWGRGLLIREVQP